MIKIFSLLNFSKEQKKRVSKNFTSLVFFNISVAIFQIFFPPLMIIIYGLENFGIWIFLTAIPASLAILNFNINDAAKVEMSIYFNKNNKKKVNEVFNNSIILTFLFVVFIIFITTLIINFYDFNLNILKDINPQNLNVILLCIFLSFYLDIINSIFKIGITFWGRQDVVTYLHIFFDLLAKLFILAAGLLFNELIFASIAFLLANIFKIIIFYFFFLNYNKHLTLFSFKLVSKSEILRLFKLSIPYYFNNTSAIIKNSFQIIILGIFFNSQIVGLVSTLKTLFYFMPHRLWGITGRIISYEFTKFYSERKFSLLKRIYFNYLKLGFIFILMFFFTSMFIGEYFYNLWLNNSYNINYMLLILIISDACFFIMGQSIQSLNISVNKFFGISLFQIIINLIIILLSYLLFYFQQSYYFLFIFNLIGSILMMLYSIYSIKTLMKKIFLNQ